MVRFHCLLYLFYFFFCFFKPSASFYFNSFNEFVKFLLFLKREKKKNWSKSYKCFWFPSITYVLRICKNQMKKVIITKQHRTTTFLERKRQKKWKCFSINIFSRFTAINLKILHSLACSYSISIPISCTVWFGFNFYTVAAPQKK